MSPKTPEQERRSLAQRQKNADARAREEPLPHPNRWDALVPRLDPSASHEERMEWHRRFAEAHAPKSGPMKTTWTKRQQVAVALARVDAGRRAQEGDQRDSWVAWADGNSRSPSVPVAEPFDGAAYLADCSRRSVEPGPLPSIKCPDGPVYWTIADDGTCLIYLREQPHQGLSVYAGGTIQWDCNAMTRAEARTLLLYAEEAAFVLEDVEPTEDR